MICPNCGKEAADGHYSAQGAAEDSIICLNRKK